MPGGVAPWGGQALPAVAGARDLPDILQPGGVKWVGKLCEDERLVLTAAAALA